MRPFAPVATATLALDFDGHRLAYRLSGRRGDGPAIVVVNQYWRPEDAVHVRMLGDRSQVFHITPVGYGKSDRVPGYAGEALPDQVIAVLDRHEVERFVVWGYSAGGAMAACVARATPRTAALICGGFSLFHRFTPGTMRTLDRRLAPDHASRSLWPWVNAFDWHHEIDAMALPTLLYWGGSDRQMASKLRRSSSALFVGQVDFVEFEGLDHGACNSSEALAGLVVPTIRDWMARLVSMS